MFGDWNARSVWSGVIVGFVMLAIVLLVQQLCYSRVK